MTDASPTVRQRELGLRLRKIRTGLGLTVEDVARKLMCSPAKVSRLETAARRPVLRDVRELCSRMAIIASGEVLLEGAPSETLASLEGRIWSRIVATDDELQKLELEFHVLSTHLVGGQHEIRVFAPSSPGAGFRPVASELEDVYFLHLSRRANSQTVVN